MPVYILLLLLLLLALVAAGAVWTIYTHRIKAVHSAILTREEKKQYANDLFWFVAAASLIIFAGAAAYALVHK